MLETMRYYDEFKTTTNRTVYNHCSLYYEDVWSSRERRIYSRPWYGSWGKDTKYPNWKLLKKKKQWSDKQFRKEYSVRYSWYSRKYTNYIRYLI